MIYFVEDDASIRELVTYTLNNTGLPAEGYDRPSAFWTAMGQNKPKLILLDIMLPEEDGMVILRKLRADPATRAIPVMMLTAKGTEYDTVLALDAGADDYVQKPFRMMELLSRIRALLRRAETYGTPAEQVVVYRVGGLEVSPSCHLVKVNGQDIALTLKEFELLCLLLENRGIVLSRDKILDKVWGDTMGRESRTVDVHIRTLRQKLGPCGERIEKNRGEIFRSNWVRPEELGLYAKAGAAHFFKIVGRDMLASKVLRSCTAYFEETYDGNLLDLMCSSIGFYNVEKSAYIDNKSLDTSGYFKRLSTCNRKCHDCSYCAELADKYVRYGWVTEENLYDMGQGHLAEMVKARFGGRYPKCPDMSANPKPSTPDARGRAGR